MADKKTPTFDAIMSDLKNRQFAPVYILMGDESYYIDLISGYIAEHALAPEEQAQPALLALIRDFLQLLDERKSAFGTLLIGFQMKALQLSGSAPQLDRCMRCGEKEDLAVLSIADGGLVCGRCEGQPNPDPLHFSLTQEQLSALRYMAAKPITALKGIGLNEETEKKLRRLFKAYIAYHLGIENLKSESLLI